MRRGRVEAAAGSTSAPDSDPMSPASPNTPPPPLLLPRNPGAVVRRDSEPMFSMVVRRRTGSVPSPGRAGPPLRSVGVSAAPAVISKSKAVLI
jgi:hypothetical protein